MRWTLFKTISHFDWTNYSCPHLIVLLPWLYIYALVFLINMKRDVVQWPVYKFSHYNNFVTVKYNPKKKLIHSNQLWTPKLFHMFIDPLGL